METCQASSIPAVQIGSPQTPEIEVCAETRPCNQVIAEAHHVERPTPCDTAECVPKFYGSTENVSGNGKNIHVLPAGIPSMPSQRSHYGHRPPFCVGVRSSVRASGLVLSPSADKSLISPDACKLLLDVRLPPRYRDYRATAEAARASNGADVLDGFVP